MMCESMCVGSLKMTFVPEPVVQPKPRERIKARSVYDFRLGDRIICVMDNDLSGRTVYIVTATGKERMLFCTNGICANETIPHYGRLFVLESETIIENGQRVVGYVNDPCPAPKPKTMKFNDLPNFSVFTSDKDWDSKMNYQFIKINRDLVMYSWKCGSDGYRMSTFCRLASPNDPSWGIWNNAANCTVIGSVKFG